MSDTTPRPGFYGNDSHTVYVTPSGRVWCVQSDDLVELPREWTGEAATVEGLSPCGDLLASDEALDYLRQVEAEGGESLIEE